MQCSLVWPRGQWRVSTIKPPLISITFWPLLVRWTVTWRNISAMRSRTATPRIFDQRSDSSFAWQSMRTTKWVRVTHPSLFHRFSSSAGKQNLSDDDHHRTKCLLDGWWSPSDQRGRNPIGSLRTDRSEPHGRLSSSLDLLYIHETHGPRFLSLRAGNWTGQSSKTLCTTMKFFSRKKSPISIVWTLKIRECLVERLMDGVRWRVFRPSYCFYLSSHRDRCSSLQARQFLVLFDNTDLSAQKIQRLILYLTYHIPQRNHFFVPSICRVRRSLPHYFPISLRFSLLNVSPRWSVRRSVCRRTVISTNICSIFKSCCF